MKRIFPLLCLLLSVTISFGQFPDNLWKEVKQVPLRSITATPASRSVSYEVDAVALSDILTRLPLNKELAQKIELPTGGGNFRSFRIWQTPIIPKELSDRYPGLYTFTAVAEDNPHVTAKLDLTPDGFHAMIYDAGNTILVNPLSNDNPNYYQCFSKTDVPVSNQWNCNVESTNAANGLGLPPIKNIARVNGTEHKTYRIAIACNYEYASAVAGPIPSKADVLSKIVTTINRVNGVYERELSISLQLVANEDSIIFNTPTNNPFSNNFAVAMLLQNQSTIDMKIGTDNYDIGHVFSTGAGGLAIVSCVCNASEKAKGVTGQPNPVGDPYDIDYVAHEIGHQFGAEHTFNANTGSCNGNGLPDHAFEPGSGSTIMAYAGICGGDNNLQPNSDAYFHAISLMDINQNITVGKGNSCGVTVPTRMNPVSIPAFTTQYYIPFKTPFELTAPEIVNHDGELRYCWEEWDLGDFEKSLNDTRVVGPIFRSFKPDTSRTRIFPAIGKLVQGITNYKGEHLPDTARSLVFKLTARNTSGGMGCFNHSDDSIKLDVVQTPAAFTVIAPGVDSLDWYGGNIQKISWDVAGTDKAPINCSNVSIWLSVDSGYSFPYHLATVPNNGSTLIVVPNVESSNAARIKVKGEGNVFFNLNPRPFNLRHNNRLPWSGNVGPPSRSSLSLSVYPVPAKDVVHIKANQPTDAGLKVVDMLGRTVWEGKITAEAIINVSSWPRGVYYIYVAVGGEVGHIAKPFVVQ